MESQGHFYVTTLFTCLGPDPAAVAVVTWLASVAMVARVVMGVAKEAVTVPRVDTPAEKYTNTQ